MRKIILLLCIITALGPALLAEGQKDDPATEKAEKVLMWSYMGGGEGELLAAMIDEYNESQTRYVAEVEYVPFGDMKQRYSMGLVSKELPDLGIVDNPDMAAFASSGLFKDITAEIQAWGQIENYFEGPVNSTLLDGKYYGIPFTSNCLALFYNKALLKEAGVDVPKTWDDLLESGRMLASKGHYALALSALKTEEGVFQFLPTYLSTGATVENPDSPEGIKALTFYKTLIDEGIMSSEVINWNQSDVQKQFSTGKAAMMINGPWNINSVRADSPDMDWGIAMVPKDSKYASVLGGENIGIIKGGNEAGAWDLLSYIADKEKVDAFISQTGYFPPRRDVAEENPRWKTDPVLSIFMEEMQFAMPRGPHAKWPQISAALAEALQKGIVGSVSPAQAMADAQVKIDDAIK